MGAAPAREDREEGGEEDRDEGGAVPIAGEEQDLNEGGGREGRAERGQHTGTGEAVAAMDMGAEGAGPVPQEEDTAVIRGVVHGDPLRSVCRSPGGVAAVRRIGHGGDVGSVRGRWRRGAPDVRPRLPQ